MTASPTAVQTLNEADYQRYRLPEDLGCFGSLQTSAGHLPLQQMDIQGEILGLLYRLKLRQRFFNAYRQPLEATYIFPLPCRAAVSSFVMQTQQRRIVGELQERGQARRNYAQAIAAGKQAALAEEERGEVFTMTVGNIPAGEWVEIELELDGPLSWADDQAMFRFPLVVAPRYIPGTPLGGGDVGSGTEADTDAVPDASRISPPRLLPGYPNPVRLSLDFRVQPGGLLLQPPTSSLVDLNCQNDGQGYRLFLPPTCDRLDRDLILRFSTASKAIQSTVNAQSDGENDHYLLLNLVPGQDAQAPPLQPRQVVTLLDRSGSMSGWKMVCARRAVGRLVDSLNDRDHFQILNFDTVVEVLDPKKPGLRQASDRERFLAMELLGKVEDRGGTEILTALEAGARLLRGASNASLILITDGQVGNESQVLSWVQKNCQGIRIYCVGIDRSVNVSLLERISQVTGGHFTLVESEEALDQAMHHLRSRIQAPLWENVELHLPGSQASPSQVHLFEGACSRLLARFQGRLPEQVEIRGMEGGRPFQRSLPVTRHAGASIHKVWARERVLDLEHGHLAGWGKPECQPQAIVRHSLEHGVLCRFTAFVAVDHSSKVDGTQHKVTQAVSHPDGWDTQALEQPVLRSQAMPFQGAPGAASAFGGGGSMGGFAAAPPAAFGAPCPSPAPMPMSPPVPIGDLLGSDCFAMCDEVACEPCLDFDMVYLEQEPAPPPPPAQAPARPAAPPMMAKKARAEMPKREATRDPLQEALEHFLRQTDPVALQRALNQLIQRASEWLTQHQLPLERLQPLKEALSEVQARGQQMTLDQLSQLQDRVRQALVEVQKPNDRKDSFWMS